MDDSKQDENNELLSTNSILTKNFIQQNIKDLIKHLTMYDRISSSLDQIKQHIN